MELFLAQLLNGVALGAVYALLATGFNLMVLVARVIHYAFPHIVLVSIYACWYTLGLTNNIVLAILAPVLLAICLNVAIEPIFRRIMSKGADINVSFVVALGISIIITDIISRKVHFGHPILFPETWTGKEAFVRSGLIFVTQGQLSTLVLSIVTVLLLFYLLYRTRLGRGFRAIGEKPMMARLIGLPVGRMAIYSYVAAGLLGGIMALSLSLLLGSASHAFGDAVAIKMLAVAIVAGLGNLRGGLICGLLLGIAEAMVIGYFTGTWSDAIAFVMMLGIILAKPQGLFGARV